MTKLEWTSLRRWLAILRTVIVLRVLAGILTNYVSAHHRHPLWAGDWPA